METFNNSLRLMHIKKKLTKPMIALQNNKTVFEICEFDGKMKFLVDVNLNDKHIYDITLHSRQKDTNKFIARIDFTTSPYRNKHYNGELPTIYKNYIGIRISEPHIHINFGENNIGANYAVPLSYFKCCNVKIIEDYEDIREAVIQYITIMSVIAKQLQIQLLANFLEKHND